MYIVKCHYETISKNIKQGIKSKVEKKVYDSVGNYFQNTGNLQIMPLTYIYKQVYFFFFFFLEGNPRNYLTMVISEEIRGRED